MKRCNQCWDKKPLKAFSGRKMNCDSCRDAASAGYVRKGRHPQLDQPGATRVQWRAHTLVGKLGGIPCSTSSGHTCPSSCSLKGNGCYAEFGFGGWQWKRLSRGDIGISWSAFIEQVRALPPGQLWRHNLAGDLPGRGGTISYRMLAELVVANAVARARGFTFTHKPVRSSKRARAAVAGANRFGFTVNLSADTPPEADRLADLDVGPVVCIVPTDSPVRSHTPAGRKILVCPAQRTDNDATCASCGWCADATRDWVVGFRAHGQMKRKVSLRVLRGRASRAEIG